MMYDVLIDTSVWSIGLRRGDKNPEYASELKKLILEYRVKIIGPIRQEILTGINNFDNFIQLKNKLAGFPDLKLATDHYVYAAELSNKCRSKGIQGSHTDFLICAVSKMNKLAIFTTDKDFEGYSSVIGLALYKTIS
jgi:predicted nucleic acid-binding protein